MSGNQSSSASNNHQADVRNFKESANTVVQN